MKSENWHTTCDKWHMTFFWHLKFWENIETKPCVTCYVSHVMSNVSSIKLFFVQRGGASWWRVYYQQGLSRLVSIIFDILFIKIFFLQTNISVWLLNSSAWLLLKRKVRRSLSRDISARHSEMKFEKDSMLALKYEERYTFMRL